MEDVVGNMDVVEEAMSTPDQADTFTIELPERLLRPFGGTPEAFAREVRLAAAVQLLRRGRVSPDEAAEVAGLGRAEVDAALPWPKGLGADRRPESQCRRNGLEREDFTDMGMKELE